MTRDLEQLQGGKFLLCEVYWHAVVHAGVVTESLLKLPSMFWAHSGETALFMTPIPNKYATGAGDLI